MAETMMQRYNTERAVVYTTLQLYRWDRIDYFESLIREARAAGYKIGVKIVRGAYLEKERQRAREMGYPSPVNPSKQATDDEYNRAITLFIDNIDVCELCLGTHNEFSCRLLMQQMAERNIRRNHPHIWFAQLYGMSDNISFNLAKAGYNVTKYLPYGPVEATLAVSDPQGRRKYRHCRADEQGAGHHCPGAPPPAQRSPLFSISQSAMSTLNARPSRPRAGTAPIRALVSRTMSAANSSAGRSGRASMENPFCENHPQAAACITPGST